MDGYKKTKKQVIRGCHDGLKKQEQVPVAGVSYIGDVQILIDFAHIGRDSLF